MPLTLGNSVLGHLLLMIAGVLPAFAQTATVRGVVRDVRGVPQMGVVVDLQGPSAAVSALTDLEGRYQIRDLSPGVYQLRASATLYLPALRHSVAIRPGVPSIVNLTLRALYDDSSLSSSGHHDPAQTLDEWRWTLRSAANKPMLRLLEEPSLGALSKEEHGAGEMHSRARLTSSAGGFGTQGQSIEVAFARQSADGLRRGLVCSSFGTAGSNNAMSSSFLATVLEANSTTGRHHRVSVKIARLPQVRNSQGRSLTVASLSSADRLELPGGANFEFGGRTQILKSGTTAVALQPFARLTVRPGGGWTAKLSVANSPELQQYADSETSDQRVPTVIAGRFGLVTDAGLHEQVSLEHAVGRATLHIAYHRDRQRRATISGQFLAGPASWPSEETSSGLNWEELAYDRSNGAFRTLGTDLASDGVSLLLDMPVNRSLAISGGLLTGGAAVLKTPQQVSSEPPFRVRKASAMILAIRQEIPRFGTRVEASYRLQPAALVSVVSPYETPEIAPYLGVHVVQPVSARSRSVSIDVTADATNMLREGYQRTNVGSQEAILATALRDLRAGIVLTF